MEKTFASLLLGLGGLMLSFAVLAFALNFFLPDQTNLTKLQQLRAQLNAPQPGQTNLVTILQNIINAVWMILIGLAVIMFMWAGILYLTASGDTERLNKAKSAVIYGVVGLAVGLLAFSILFVVRTILGV